MSSQAELSPSQSAIRQSRELNRPLVGTNVFVTLAGLKGDEPVFAVTVQGLDRTRCEAVVRAILTTAPDRPI